MTNRPLPNLYDAAADVHGAAEAARMSQPEPIVGRFSIDEPTDAEREKPNYFAQATAAHGDDVFKANNADACANGTCDCEEPSGVEVEIGAGDINEFISFLGALASAGRESPTRRAINAMGQKSVQTVAEKMLLDFDAALGAVIEERATAVEIARTLRDGVNPRRKVLVNISIEMVEADPDEDTDTDGFVGEIM